MGRWGLFLLSIGFLVLLFSANARTGEYDVFSMTTAFFLIIVGTYLVFRKKQQNKKN